MKRTKQPTQAELYGELLADEQRYHHDAQQGYLPDGEEQEALIARVRAGDSNAREHLILRFMSYCDFLARKYANTYWWASPRIEYQDLAQFGMLAILSRLDRAMVCDNPVAYLVKVLRYEISDYCLYHSSLISTPEVNDRRYPKYKPMQVDSLDVPLCENDQRGEASTLADVLEADPLLLDNQEQDHTLLYQAVEALPPRQRETIQRHYGLDCAPESLNAISWSMAKHPTTRPSCAMIHKRRALEKLHVSLENVYSNAS